MIYGKQQEQEIKTIRKRTLELNLSDADVERLAIKAAKGNITVSQLLENFIGDLVGGTYSNGSDERMKAQEWYDRCWFGSLWETTSLLQYLARSGCMEYVLEHWDRYQFLSKAIQNADSSLEAGQISKLEIEKRKLHSELEAISKDFGGFSAWEEVAHWQDELNRTKAEGKNE